MNIQTKGQRIFNVFNILFLALLGFLTFYPFWYVLVASFNVGSDFVRGGVYFWPRAFTLENYQRAFRDPRIFDSLQISVLRTAIGVVVGLFFTSLIAYACTVKTLPGRTGFIFLFYFTTIFGGGMIPYFILLRNLGLNRSFWLYVIPGVFSFMNFLLMRVYFDTLPEELRESAKMDGAGHVRILFQIYWPLSAPIIATLALFIGVGHWNDWFTGAFFQSRTELFPAATLLQRLLSEASPAAMREEGQEVIQDLMRTFTPMSLQMAFVMILTMPIVALYPFLQKYFVKGVMIGAIKG
ncbi:MAG: carbohydrate ABC transporter permease [Defluviitaleaceae bacterium]|nr:carbohydrate ABC transporter permease [Defluviitaleaceae bacterium]